MKKYLITLALASLAGTGAWAANNTGGAGELNQKPSLPPTTNPAAPAPAGPVGNDPVPDNTGMTQIGDARPVAAPPPRKGMASNPDTEMQRSTATEISFRTGNTELTPEARLRLDQIMVEAHRRGQIEEVKVVSWGDIAYPATNKKSVPAGQKDLAKNRNATIEAYLKEHNNGVNIESYNMAERPSALSDLLKSSEGRIKKSFESAGIAGKQSTKRGSRAIVMVVLK